MYVDTSALFAYYLLERMSQNAENIIRNADIVYVSALTDVEFYSALRKRNRMGDISENDMQKIHLLYKSHRKMHLYHFLTIQKSDFKSAEYLLGQATQPLRTLDALHLGIAENNGLSIFTYDRVLHKTAIELGIDVTSYAG